MRSLLTRCVYTEKTGFMSKISVIDYGIGNSASIINMVHKAGGQASLCSSPECLESTSAIILPGIGSFDNGMDKLKETGFLDVIENKVFDEKKPFLGICLGMQLLFESSEEGQKKGLGWLRGEVIKFDFSSLDLAQLHKVPHMGWNIVRPINFNNLYAGLEGKPRFYFVHSYHVQCSDASDILATSQYGYEFTCSVRHNNIWGAQFHPEKSHRYGVQFFKNFLKEVSNA